MLMLIFVLLCSAGLIGAERSESDFVMSSGRQFSEVKAFVEHRNSVEIPKLLERLLKRKKITGARRVALCDAFEQDGVRVAIAKECDPAKRKKIMQSFVQKWLLRNPEIVPMQNVAQSAAQPPLEEKEEKVAGAVKQESGVRLSAAQRKYVADCVAALKQSDCCLLPEALLPLIADYAQPGWRWVPYYDEVCKSFCKNASPYPRFYVAYKNEQSMVSVVRIESSKDSFWLKCQNDLFQQLGIHRGDVIRAVQEHFGSVAQSKIWHKGGSGLFDSPEWIARGLLEVPAYVMKIQDPRYQKAVSESAILMHESVTYEDFMSCAVALRQQAQEKQVRGEELNHKESEVLREQAAERIQHLQELLKKPLAPDEEIVFYREQERQEDRSNSMYQFEPMVGNGYNGYHGYEPYRW